MGTILAITGDLFLLGWMCWPRRSNTIPGFHEPDEFCVVSRGRWKTRLAPGQSLEDAERVLDAMENNEAERYRRMAMRAARWGHSFGPIRKCLCGMTEINYYANHDTAEREQPICPFWEPPGSP